MFPKRIIPAVEIAIRQTDKIFASDCEGNLYHARLVNLANGQRRCDTLMAANFIGKLLGQPQALAIDPDERLFYYLPRDGCVVRWDSK